MLCPIVLHGNFLHDFVRLFLIFTFYTPFNNEERNNNCKVEVTNSDAYTVCMFQNGVRVD